MVSFIVTVCENGHKVWHRPHKKDGRRNIPKLCVRCNGNIVERIRVGGEEKW